MKYFSIRCPSTIQQDTPAEYLPLFRPGQTPITCDYAHVANKPSKLNQPELTPSLRSTFHMHQKNNNTPMRSTRRWLVRFPSSRCET